MAIILQCSPAICYITETCCLDVEQTWGKVCKFFDWWSDLIDDFLIKFDNDRAGRVCLENIAIYVYCGKYFVAQLKGHDV